MKFRLPLPAPFAPSRRRFVQGVALGGVAAGIGYARMPAFAVASSDAINMRSRSSAREFDLSIGESPVNFTGVTHNATVIN